MWGKTADQRKTFLTKSSLVLTASVGKQFQHLKPMNHFCVYVPFLKQIYSFPTLIQLHISA